MIPRYSRLEMAALWTPERRYQTWLQVELAAARAMADAGLVPSDVRAIQPIDFTPATRRGSTRSKRPRATT